MLNHVAKRNLEHEEFQKNLYRGIRVFTDDDHDYQPIYVAITSSGTVYILSSTPPVWCCSGKETDSINSDYVKTMRELSQDDSVALIRLYPPAVNRHGETFCFF